MEIFRSIKRLFFRSQSESLPSPDVKVFEDPKSGIKVEVEADYSDEDAAQKAATILKAFQTGKPVLMNKNEDGSWEEVNLENKS